MAKSMRESTIQTLGLGSVLDIFKNGKLPTSTGDLVDQVFGKTGSRGALGRAEAEFLRPGARWGLVLSS